MNKSIGIILIFLLGIMFQGSFFEAKAENESLNECEKNILEQAEKETSQQLSVVKKDYEKKVKATKSQKRKKELKKKFEQEKKKLQKALKEKIKTAKKACLPKDNTKQEQKSDDQNIPFQFPDLGNNNASPSSCQNITPVFTADITDLSKVQWFTPPVTIQGNYLKGHGYFKVAEKVPVYAPVDGLLQDGSFYLEDNRGQYSLSFEVSCDVVFMVDHLSEVVPPIKRQFSDTPAMDSRTNFLDRSLFKAGDLIGYSIGTDLGKTWDFGVYNFTQENPYNSPQYPDFESFKNKNAICPFTYFEASKKAVYKNLLRDIGGNTLTSSTNLCSNL